MKRHTENRRYISEQLPRLFVGISWFLISTSAGEYGGEKFRSPDNCGSCDVELLSVDQAVQPDQALITLRNR